MPDQNFDLFPHRLRSRRSRINTTITGGGLSTGEFPSCGGIGNSSGWINSSVLVSDRIAFTAAHPGGAFTRSRFGSIDLTDTTVPFQVGHSRAHPTYVAQQGAPYDLSIFRSNQEVQGVQPVSIASSEELSDATKVTLVGFGTTSTNANDSLIQRFVEVSILYLKNSQFEGHQVLPNHWQFNADLEFVVGNSSGSAGSCFTDSGGAALIKVDAKWKLAGIIKGSAVPGNSCQGVTRVTLLEPLKSFWAPIIKDPEILFSHNP